MRSCISLVVFVLLGTTSLQAAPFVAVKADTPLPDIIIQYDAKAGTGFDWKATQAKHVYDRSPLSKVRHAAHFLQEGIRKITGKTLTIRNGVDLSAGIVLTTLAGAPELKEDPAVRKALANDGSDSYNDREAFYLRSEPGRLLVVANTADGLAAGVVELLESVDYEILAMGPSWIHVPKDRHDVLVFDIERAGRPSYYLRNLTPTSGQSYGVGTIFQPKVKLDEPDEDVSASYLRWAVGQRHLGQSMPGFPGHALQAYHRAVVYKMKENGTTDGFLVAATKIGTDAERPPAGPENADQLWINSDAKGQPGFGKVYHSTGKNWRDCNLAELGVNIDLSVPMVRSIILEEMKKRAQSHFAQNPEDPFIFGTDAEDGGGYARLAKLIKNPNWYPEYLKAEGVTLGKPYVLHKFMGLDQPTETWDPAAPGDTVYGFNNWLLREFDKWIDSLPEKERLSTSGKSKKELVRCSLYSYNYHDVPPNFNLDPRIRVMIASYPKHRGMGKWKNLVTQRDMARAYQVMLPREPSGDYRIISLSYFRDIQVEGIVSPWSAAPARIADDLGSTYRAGVKALSYETDFNFGKHGLAYYLLSKMLWNANLTAKELDALSDRWLQRAYGGGWREMKKYYDFLLPENFPVNGPNTWARAIRMLDAAAAKIDGKKEPDAQRRLDEHKQHWFYYYLIHAGKATKTDPDMREFAWKGQTSYAVAHHVILRRTFGTSSVADALPEPLRRGPAHYTHDETEAWWKKVLAHWPYTPVSVFADAVLADGRKGKDVDLNDLVPVKAFASRTEGVPFLYNSGYQKPGTFLTTATKAGDEIGFQLFWPFGTPGDRYYMPRELPYGVDYWDAKTKTWEPLVDKTMIKHASIEVPETYDKRPRHLVNVRLKAPRPGTYKFDIGYGGNAARLASPGFDLATGKYVRRPAHTYFTTAEGLTQAPVYVYIPKGTKSFDLEVWDASNVKKLTLYQGVSSKVSRQVDIGKRGTHTIALNPGEDGCLARIEGNGFAFPFLYSVPSLWATSPAELLVPRAIAEADGLQARP